MRVAGLRLTAPLRAEAVMRMGALSVSTRATPPIGSNNGSAAAVRCSNGSSDW